jgi:hypothetical protein
MHILLLNGSAVFISFINKYAKISAIPAAAAYFL